MKAPSNGFAGNPGEGERKNINSELWHACAGPLVSLPPMGSLVVYFPQGHSEQVAASMQKDTDSIPNYPSLPSKLICVLHNVTLHADAETDEVYAEMTLQPVTKCDREALLASDLGLKQNKQPAEFFCKTLTASDTSTHGGFSVPRRAAEKIFPTLDFSMQPPAQELMAKDLHDISWTFRHIYRGQPKRHLLTTGWSVFVSTKRLLAGDSVLFVRDEKSQLLLGIRRAIRQQPALSSSVLSSDSMHIGILAAAAHATANNSPFTIFYNPRATPSEFVIPLAKYYKAMYTQVSIGMRFRMMFETEESGIRRYMGTITGVSDLDPIRWKNSQWRNLQVGWDESTAGERRNRVSVWEIEPVATPFYLCPPFFRPKFPREPGMPDDGSEVENVFKQSMPWLSDSMGLKDVQSPIFTGLNVAQWMNMQQNPQFIASAAQSGLFPSMVASAIQNGLGTEDAARIFNFQTQALPLSNLPFNIPKPAQQVQLLDQFQQASLVLPQTQLHQQALPHPQQQQQQPQLQQIGALPQQQQPVPHQLPLPQQQSQAMPLHIQHQQQQDQPLSASLLKQQQQILQQQQQSVIHSQQHPQPHLTLVQQQKMQQMQQQQQSQHNQIRSVNSNLGVFDQQQKQHQAFASQSLPQTQQLPNQILHSPPSQLQQQSFPIPNSQIHQNLQLPNQNPSQPVASLPQNLQFQQQLEQQKLLSQRQQQQVQQIQIPQPQLQLQLLQKLQQQQQQHVLSQLSPRLQPQSSPQQQLAPLQNPQFHQQQWQQDQSSSMLLSPTSPKQHQFPIQGPSQLKPLPSVKDQPILPQSGTLSILTSPTSNASLVSSRNLLSKNQPGPVMLPGETTAQPVNNLVQELQNKSDACIKNELHCMKETDQQAYRHGNGMNDQLDASSSATSFCLDGSAQESLSLPPLCLDSEIHVDPRSNHSFGTNVGLSPDTLLSKGFGSGKDLQNLLAAYGNQRDIEPELSTAAISSQSFGVPNIPFKPGSSGEAAANENGVFNRGIWSNQQQRMRTYTKVQKRGSVGRCIDVTRYKGYNELRHDLACMFGIEGLLEDPHRTDWKLVYVDHENDILLVGDDPWEEFVSCVQSIKILSSVEVQQMSLDGDLVNVPVQNPACSGSDNGNMWKGHYDDNSAASFNR